MYGFKVSIGVLLGVAHELHAARTGEAIDGLGYPLAGLHLPVQRAEGGKGSEETLAMQ